MASAHAMFDQKQLQKALSIEPLLGELEKAVGSGTAPRSRPAQGHCSRDDTRGGRLSPVPAALPLSFNCSFMPKEREWLMKVLESSSDEEEEEEQEEQEKQEEPGDDEERVKFMLQLHCQCLRWRREYSKRRSELEGVRYYSAGVFMEHDPYREGRPACLDRDGWVVSTGQRKRMAPGRDRKCSPHPKKTKSLPRTKHLGEREFYGGESDTSSQQASAQEDGSAERSTLWQFIAKKEVPKAAKTMSSSRQKAMNGAKKVAVMCQKEVRKAASKSWKLTKDSQARAKRMVRELLVYLKKHERVEKEQRKKAEKEAERQRRLDEEMREAQRQQRKLNFLITQTELYAHFIAKKLSNDKDLSEDILKKLEEAPLRREVKPGVVVDLEQPNKYDCEAAKAKVLANVEGAFRSQKGKLQRYHPRGPEQEQHLQESFDRSFSLANPSKNSEQPSLPEHPQPKLFNGQLKGYQMQGMNWLVNLYNQGINGILADEMGLGKTIQTIALLAHLAEVQGIWGPFLVVTPASTLHNWQQECGRFVPRLTVMPYWGNQQERKTVRKFWNQKLLSKTASPFHILVTSYQVVVADAKYFQRVQWQHLILDEAQAIKSSSSQRWKVLLGFNSRNRLLLTGTPIQNSMAELWALLHFIMPLLFDSHGEFSEWFSKDIESHATEKKSGLDENQLTRLHMILKPFMLRRIKKDVANEMAPKVEVELFCPLTPRQQCIYQRLRNRITVEELLQGSAVGGADRSHTSSLMNLVMQFRKVCNHVELFERREASSPLFFSLPSCVLPRLVFDEGLLHSTRRRRWKILTVILGVFATDHLHSGFSGDLAALRLSGFTPSEVNRLATGCLVQQMTTIVDTAKSVAVAYRQWMWSSESQKTRPLLRLWPFLRMSSASVQESPALASLVMVTPGRICLPPATQTLSHDHSHVMFTHRPPTVPEALVPVKGSECSRASRSGLPKMAEHHDWCCIPSFVAMTAEKVVAQREAMVCSRRSAEVQGEELRRGGSPHMRAVLSMGLLEASAQQSTSSGTGTGRGGSWSPRCVGGISSVYPPNGWSRVSLPDKNHIITGSGKLLVLDGLLARLKREGHRVLIYSQMTRMIDVLEDYMQYRQYTYTRLDGSSSISDRRDMVENFQTRQDIFVFLLSTRAGGLGINLTAADTVVFYDSDWNPTVDQQAMDRAHRLGQTRQVTVYRLIVKGTVEDRILQRAREKSAIHRMVVQGGEFKSDAALKPKEVVSLLLDDAEVETKLMARETERRQQSEKQKKSRKRTTKLSFLDEPSSKRSTGLLSTKASPGQPSAASNNKKKKSNKSKKPRGRGAGAAFCTTTAINAGTTNYVHKSK